MADLHIHEQFISLLETNLGIILKISKAYTNTAQDREDLVNDIAYQMWKAYPNFKGKSKISTWMYRIALNTAMNYRKNTRKQRDFLKDSVGFYADEPSNESDSDPQVELLYECIAELDEFSKAIILLYLDGYRHDEIAEITGISKSNVGTRISRIKEQLRNLANSKKHTYGT
jgi:RNA polymerase sigma-70 factor (ECF subfamily)